ncbi:penicillin-binding transpeptidase domain-containing protein [Streptomyces sp. SAJ15]|uniref:penicillin-binding transpeptidase domain-containing protein n=1 Tax=Streptomyces sp. SAJ15 TaxID=2011095 RepID=UPI001186629B|nr:penicillin-binding transpeptidase domain-containing protein [Streptomyces sp. SAJ15]TVL91673.1 penicillin-binding protein [Streptomyces sp. SAJ15]
MRTVGRIVLGGVVAGVVGVAGVGVYNIYDAMAGGSSGTERPDGPLSDAQVTKAASDFLTAWQNGNDQRAAGFTNDAVAALGALTRYREGTHVTKVKLTQGEADGTEVPFTVAAHIDTGEKRSTWTYESSLDVVRGETSGRPLVSWKTSVLHPKLKTSGDTLMTGEAALPSSIKVLDRHGKALDEKDFPSLSPVLASLRKRYATESGGSPAIAIQVNGSPSQVLHILRAGKPGTLRTTVDAKAQRAAEAQVARHEDASVVAVKPSTGEILAIANSARTEFNTALQGQTAPGSTFKIVTAATLLEQGKVTAEKSLPCPKYAAYRQGKSFHNLESGEQLDATFAEDFAASCNTAFVSLADEISDDALAAEAREVFGIGPVWNIGVSSSEGKVPTEGGDEKAAAMIGQGRVQMNALTMASVAATAQSGRFRQPYLVAPSLDHREVATAERALTPAVARQLKSMMRLTATSGTGARAMTGLRGDIGAKTGSAEVDGQGRPDAWFTAYRGDMAAAARVPASGHGGDTAGPVVRAVLGTGG